MLLIFSIHLVKLKRNLTCMVPKATFIFGRDGGGIAPIYGKELLLFFN
jgi:hypothetical protein